jgi:hypothetical protein
VTEILRGCPSSDQGPAPPAYDYELLLAYLPDQFLCLFICLGVACDISHELQVSESTVLKEIS